MTLIKYSSVLILLFFNLNSFSQDKRPLGSFQHTSVYFGIVEDAAWFSLNATYDMITEGYFGCSVKAGIGVNHDFDGFIFSNGVEDPGPYLVFPFRISALYSKNREHFLEVGMATSFFFSQDSKGKERQDLYFLPVIGYKRITIDSRFTARVFVTWPVYDTNPKDIYLLPVGGSLGVRLW
ncbi:MAG: hypothetical protein R2769_04035 [Saprospiraceae bacterium]